jgi:hypothetical protein
MTQQEIKKLASEMIGDDGTPNMWFVTAGPYIAVEEDASIHGEGMSYELIDGYEKNSDTCTYGPFNTYEDAVECYDEQELCVDNGVGQVMIEDRQCGVVKEKWLVKKTVVQYVEDEYDDSHLY